METIQNNPLLHVSIVVMLEFLKRNKITFLVIAENKDKMPDVRPFGAAHAVSQVLVMPYIALT